MFRARPSRTCRDSEESKCDPRRCGAWAGVEGPRGVLPVPHRLNSNFTLMNLVCSSCALVDVTVLRRRSPSSSSVLDQEDGKFTLTSVNPSTHAHTDRILPGMPTHRSLIGTLPLGVVRRGTALTALRWMIATPANGLRSSSPTWAGDHAGR